MCFWYMQFYQSVFPQVNVEDLYSEAKEMRELNEKKVEALREKWAATIMMLSEEYTGARHKLLSAQKLYPELDKINLMVTICDILMLASSVRLINTDIDFYCILDLIYPSATYSDARYYYLHDLVTSIDGIKDEFPGAELALEVVQHALNMVTDREKHFYHGFKHDSGLISSNEICTYTSERCRDIPDADVLLEQSSLEESIEVDQECPQQEFYNFEEERKVNLFEPGQIWAAHYHADEAKQCLYAKINFNSGDDVLSITWLKPIPVGAVESIWCNSNTGFPVACGAFCMDINACDEVSAGIFSYKCSWVCGVVDDQIEIYPKRAEIWAVYIDGVVGEWTCNPEAPKGCKFQLIEMFSDYSKCSGGDFYCLVKVNGFRSVFKRQTCRRRPVLFHISPNSLLFSHKIPAFRLLGGKDEVLFELDQMALPNNLIQHIGASNSRKDSNSENELCVGEFQFLKSKISADDFAAGQVWAIYCGKDTMPRQYVMVKSVVSNRQVCVTTLEPEIVHDYKKKWREDLPIASGTFKYGTGNVILDMSQFSHLVKYVQDTTTRPQCMIYPQKGEIWAMYKNWNRKWEHSDYEKGQCWMVEIISNFSKENGIQVAKLEEVDNCLTFFHRQQHEGFDISFFETEMLSFSHQVLAYRVPGIERYGIPEDSWHLEPRAIIPPQPKV